MRGIEEPAYDMVWSRGCNYAVIEEGWIDRRPVHLGGHLVRVGDKFEKLGNGRKASQFEMQSGHFLRFEGWAWVDKVILFSPDGVAASTVETAPANWYYAFHYISDKVLFVSGNGSGWTVEWK